MTHDTPGPTCCDLPIVNPRHASILTCTTCQRLYTLCCCVHPLQQKRRGLLVCPGCERHYSMETHEQVESWAWEAFEVAGRVEFRRRSNGMTVEEGSL